MTAGCQAGREERLMRAVVYREYGEARDVLRLEEVPVPEPGPGEVRVRITVAGVNNTDSKSRRNITAPHRCEPFQVPGQDAAGVVDAVGAGVPAERVGERVWVWMAAADRPWGTAGEYTVVPAEQAQPLPDGASDDLGATLGIPALTAQYCLAADARSEERSVLVAGGAGAVGHYAIELAKRRGLFVIATVSSEAKAERARVAGADLVLNYREEDVAARVLEAVPGGVDRIVEVALMPSMELDMAVAAPNATVAAYASPSDMVSFPFRGFMNKGLGLRFVVIYVAPRAALVAGAEEISAALADGALTGLPVTRFGLDDLVAAHEAVEAGVDGKVLVDVARG